MLRKIFKLFLPTLFWASFAYVVINIKAPGSITEAGFSQLTFFFTPFVLALIFTLKLFLKSFYKSIIISFGIVLLLVLKSLAALNLLTGIITILAIILLMGSFKRKI